MNGGGSRPDTGFEPLVFGVETDPLASEWSLTGDVYCAAVGPAQPVAGDAAKSFKAVEVVEAEKTSAKSSKKTLAECPNGKRAIGGGVVMSSANDTGITLMRTSKKPHGFRSSVRELGSVAGDWTVESRAICANITTETATSDYAYGPISGGEISPRNSSSPKVVIASCPAGYVIGGKATLSGESLDERPPGDVVVTTSAPNGTGSAVSSWVAIARESDPVSSDWELRAGVSCATMTAGPPQ